MTKQGGAIFVENTVSSNSNYEVLITNTTFQECSAYIGGAVFTLNGLLSLSENSSFTNNYATISGGAL
jgi:hypothetical protein